MSVKHKVSGFFTAVIVAVVSFFVIFLFFPTFSQKYLGTSFKSDKKVQQTVSSVTSDVLDKATKTVTDIIKK